MLFVAICAVLGNGRLDPHAPLGNGRLDPHAPLGVCSPGGLLPWGSAPLGSGLPSCKRHRSALVLNHNQALAGSKWETGDLTLYFLYFEQRNATAAQNLHASIVQSAESLPLMPYLFRLGRVTGTREHVVHPNYIVVFQVGNDAIDILRVLHSRQQYP